MGDESSNTETGKFNWKGIALLLIGTGLLFLVIQYIGIKDIAFVIYTLKWYYLLAIIALAALMVCIEVLRFKEIVNALGLVSYKKLFPIHLGGMFLNTITPGARVGGEFAKAHYVRRLIPDKKYSQTFSLVTINSLMYGIVLSVIGTISAAYIIITKRISLVFGSVLALVLFSFFMIVLIAVLLYRKRGEFFKTLLGKFILGLVYQIEKHREVFKGKGFKFYQKNKTEWFDEFVDVARDVMHKKGCIFNVICLQIIASFVYFTEVFLITRGLNIEMDYFAIILITSVSLFIGFFMFIPGGVGIIEASMIYLYSLFGIGATAAAAITLIDRIIFYLIVFVGGYVALMWLGWRYHVKPLEVEAPKLPEIKKISKSK